MRKVCALALGLWALAGNVGRADERPPEVMSNGGAEVVAAPVEQQPCAQPGCGDWHCRVGGRLIDFLCYRPRCQYVPCSSRCPACGIPPMYAYFLCRGPGLERYEGCGGCDHGPGCAGECHRTTNCAPCASNGCASGCSSATNCAPCPTTSCPTVATCHTACCANVA